MPLEVTEGSLREWLATHLPADDATAVAEDFARKHGEEHFA